MNAEIIAVGSELLTAHRTDTNSLYLTGQLNNLGVEVTTKYVVGDNCERVADTIRRAMSRSEIVILSGGLGPTEDDVTRDAAAAALDRKLIFHPELNEWLEQRFRKANRQMAEVNRRQAFILEGAEILPNDRGTAPGQWVDEADASVILLPGPPHELEAMFTRQCLPRLARRVPRRVIRTLVLRVAGMAESDLDQTISPVYKKYDNPATTILSAPGDIQIHLRARCATEAEAAELLAEVAGPVEMLLGDRIYSRDGATLEACVGELLRKHAATLAVAESCTGGLLAERITAVPGSSAYFLGGLVTYSSELKTEWLGVSPQTIQEFGAVSKETAEAMALGVRRRAGSTFGVSITCVAGPDRQDDIPVGMVYAAVADGNGCRAVNRQFLGDRGRVRDFASQMALDLLRRRLILVAG